MIIVPAGHVAHAALILLGPILATPDGLKTKLPEPPEEVDQARVAKAVPVKFIVELDPGHKLVDEVRFAIGGATTVIVPVAFTVTQPPVSGMTKLNVPIAVGVPEIVIVLLAQFALIPAGKPLAPLTPALLIPVALVVLI